MLGSPQLTPIDLRVVSRLTTLWVDEQAWRILARWLALPFVSICGSGFLSVWFCWFFLLDLDQLHKFGMNTELAGQSNK
jgi:hypothetical protein